MSKLTPQLVDDVVAVCKANATDIAAALSRIVGSEIGVSVGEPATFDNQTAVEGAGLLVSMQLGDVALAAVLPGSSGLLPKAKSTDFEKLNTLAAELSTLVLPEALQASKLGAVVVDNLAKSLADGKLPHGASMVPLLVTLDGEQSKLTLLWPCENPAGLLPTEQTTEQQTKLHDKKPTAAANAPKRAMPASLNELPPYAKHLLKISVPVSVRLVAKKVSVKEVLELGPGAMVSFDKSCDGPLELTVGDQVIAQGAAVKVGEYFGLEIDKMTLPVEHFWPVRKTG